MKILIISYSFTKNNEKLAKKIAQTLNADFSVLEEKKKRTVLTILLDILFNRTPSIKENEKQFDQYENLIFVAPVWFGKIATPLRALFKELKGKVKVYSFVSISAGINGEKNPNLEKELMDRTKLMPKAVINPFISEILPSYPSPTRKELDSYKITDKDTDEIVMKIINELN